MARVVQRRDGVARELAEAQPPSTLERAYQYFVRFAAFECAIISCASDVVMHGFLAGDAFFDLTERNVEGGCQEQAKEGHT